MSRRPRSIRLLPVVILVLLAILLIPREIHETVIVLLVTHRSSVYSVLLLAGFVDVLFLGISWRKRFNAPYFFARENAQRNLIVAIRILFLLALLSCLVWLLTRFAS